MYSQATTIVNKTGLHARPATAIVKKAKEFDASIILKCGEKEAKATSMISILAMNAINGADIEVRAEGNDEETAVKEMVALLEDACGE